jgi:cell division protein FtsA
MPRSARPTIDRVVEAARAIDISEDREVFHVIPQEFTVDSQNGIKDPVGMAGVRLEAEVHIVHGGMTPARNPHARHRALRPQGGGPGAGALASAHAVVAREEKDLGVACSTWGAAPPTWPSSLKDRSGTPAWWGWGA